MKKIYIALAVIPAMMLVSCQQEQSFNDLQLGEFDVAFTISNGATRSGESTPLARQGAIIPIETEAGHSLFLEETIVDLDQIGTEPATKGTPAYTENLGVLYANELMVQGNKGLFQTETGYWNLDKQMVKGGWRYQGSYEGNPWPEDEDESVDLYFRMPSTQRNVTNITRSGGKFTFNYTSPKVAKEQQDILFAYRPLSKAQHKAYLKQGGTPILFNHALSGVKFAISNESDELANVGIQKVIITNLRSSGKCELTPAKEGDYRDSTGVYSSAKVAKWTLNDTRADFNSEDFGDPVSYENGGSFATMGQYGDSFAPTTINNEKANTQNLNDADGTQTFWFIPQEITDDVELTIVFTEDGGTTYIPWTVKFGAALKKATGGRVEWKAGELRTYSIKIDLVNLTVDDDVHVVKGKETLYDETDEGQDVPFTVDSYKGSYKDNVVITNTGNTDAFIRATIIGQWYDAETNAPVFGFTDFANGAAKVKSVDSWYKDQFVNEEDGVQGTFEGLPGYKGAGNENNHNWVFDPSDGYYYYKNVVPVGERIPASDSLFTRYTVGSVPTVRIAGEGRPLYFVMEIATQAVSANKLDGSHYTYKEAWDIEERIK